MKTKPDPNEFMPIEYMESSSLRCRKFFSVILFLAILGISAILLFGCSTAKVPPEPESEKSITSHERPLPDRYMSEGMSWFKKGAFGKAISAWLEAARLFEKEERFKEKAETLILLAQAYQSMGQYNNALKSLEVALSLASQSGDRNRIAAILGQRGNTYLAIGNTKEAHKYLTEALSIARDLERPGLTASILNNLGNLFASRGNYREANRMYKESIVLANKIGNKELVAVSLVNAALSSMGDKKYDESESLLKKALDQFATMPPSHDMCYGLINIGLTYYDLSSHLNQSKDRLLVMASKAFKEAASVSDTIGDLQSQSYALGYLGKVCESAGQHQKALELSRRAIFAAQQTNTPESLYLWHWQTGRLLKAQGELDKAIAAYRRAVDALKSTRDEISIIYGRQRASFRESVGPLYFELVDLLLQRAALDNARENYEPYLIEARNMIETLKIVELQDYFRDECVDKAQAKVTSLDAFSKTAIVIYPVLLPDRLELLVSLPEGLKRYPVPVEADRITSEVRKFRKRLEKRISRQYLHHAKKLYDWLVRPIEKDLAFLSIDTLVFVPDGPLRTIPMAALHDGKQFLIERYALAITPGLDLSDPRPIETENLRLLLVGLSKSSQGFPPLPYIPEELKNIQDIYGGKLLLNEKFLLSNLEENLKKETFNIVHIATHGKFESNAQETFILTFDDKLTLDRLDKCVGFFRFREDPLELLTLSACQTAAGDDRAALGLAGVAVKAGARSALATLWYINDQASSTLVSEFYRQLFDPNVSRAVALQRAQLKLLKDLRYEHPSYWSPFLLINNWL